MENLLQYINDGGPPIMWTLVVLFVFGLAITFWRLVVIVLAMMSTRSLYIRVLEALREPDGGLEKASEICKKTPGPVATIVHAGLSRVTMGVDLVERAIENAGAIEMAFLENGLAWLATIATVSPMIGFFGTVAGMIKAFRDIAAMGDVQPSVVAGGISIALITTAGGLLVAIPIQMAYNLCVYLIDRIGVSMEENASQLIDTLIEMDYIKTSHGDS
ncbi:MotA/TolQ/ExbB proton channel family protein [Candidatus Latescibacterota bacterium]